MFPMILPVLLHAAVLSVFAAKRATVPRVDTTRRGDVGLFRTGEVGVGERWAKGTAGRGIEVVSLGEANLLVVDDTVRAVTRPLGEEPGTGPIGRSPSLRAFHQEIVQKLGAHDRVRVFRFPVTVPVLHVESRIWIWDRPGGEVQLVAKDVGFDTAMLARMAEATVRREVAEGGLPRAMRRRRAGQIRAEIEGTLSALFSPRQEFEMRVWSRFDGRRLARALGTCIGDTLCELDARFLVTGDSASFWSETAPASWYALGETDSVALSARVDDHPSVTLSWRAAVASFGDVSARSGDSASVERNRPALEAALRPALRAGIERFFQAMDAPTEGVALDPFAARIAVGQADAYLAYRRMLDVFRPGHGVARTDSDLVAVGGGCFAMGSDSDEDASPAHQVCLDSFRIARRETSQPEFARVMNLHPWRSAEGASAGPDLPAARVSWNEAREYCRRIGRRLPTEAEFEFLLRGTDSLPPWKNDPSAACRHANLADSALNLAEARNQAGFDSAIGDDPDGDYADWKAIASRRSEIFPCSDGFAGLAPRGRFSADARGVMDLWGNVAEWTADRHGSYDALAQRNPTGAESGDERVIRGGSSTTGPSEGQPWSRRSADEFHRDLEVGFRCAAD